MAIESKPTLHRDLKERHINLMALGSTIGVGLFLGAATAIQLAGPAVLLSYIIGGCVIFLIMRALGEMAIYDPVSGSFSRYAQNYLGPLPGYLTGWNYWFLWLTTCMAEITAIGVYMNVWFPDSPQWIWALSAAVIMTGINFVAVKAFGEFEFWFALIKIVTIVLMIVMGFGMILFGIGNGGIATGIDNLWRNGGFMPHGIKGLLSSLQMVMYAYLGIEMLGITAGEAKNPKKSLARAVDSVFWRILIFYVGSLFVIMSIYPWDQIGIQGSPFVITFSKMGIPAAAGIINFVVLTAALSSCNGGIFSTARMLYSLAEQGEAPRVFKQLSSRGVPIFAAGISGFIMLIGVLLNYIAPKEVFSWMTAIATFAVLWTWMIILLSQLKFRKVLLPDEYQKLTHKMPFWPYGSYIALSFLLLVTVLMAISPDTRIALIVGPIWMILLILLYYAIGLHRRVVKPLP